MAVVQQQRALRRTDLLTDSRILPFMNSIDKWLSALDNALRTLAAPAKTGRVVLGLTATPGEELDAPQRHLSGALMRVNHVGEVCAQALYQAQALTAGSESLRQQMRAAAREEADHLAWTEQRLQELQASTSLLNPVWYAGSFVIGMLAGRLGDRVSLGFVIETERQVEAHLASHLHRLPEADHRSRQIVEAMKEDERRHAEEAQRAGGAPLPAPVRGLMGAAARVMTATAFRI